MFAQLQYKESFPLGRGPNGFFSRVFGVKLYALEGVPSGHTSDPVVFSDCQNT
jgi:hypothetical protein